jgi:prepilin-type N-terminal cleavage/methylation domain-containing protein
MSQLGRSRRRGRRQRGFTLIEILIVTFIIGVLISIAVPSFQRARETARAKTCSQNLRALESAKDQYLMDRNLARTTTVYGTDIAGSGLYLKSMPECPSLGTYTVGSGDIEVSCDFGPTHNLNGN